MVAIKNQGVIVDQLAAVREAAKLIEPAQAAVGYCPLQSLNGRGSLLSALPRR
jgi:hypothetical protein